MRLSPFLFSPVVRSIVAVTAIFWVIAPWFPGRQVIEFVDGIAITVSAVVMIAYGRRFRKSLAEQDPNMLDLMIMGIAGGWLINSLDRAWRLVARVTGSYQMMDNHMVGYLLSMLTLFACYHLIVRGADANTIEIQRRLSAEATSLIVIAVILGAALGALAVSLDLFLLGS